MERINNIKLVKDEECCGCGACINNCPQGALFYSNDDNGFLCPDLRLDKCINCGKCLKVCPVLVIHKNKPIKAIAAISKNPAVIKSSSSGGIFFEIASFIIQNKGVVYGCAMDSNFQVKHNRVDCYDDLQSLMRSKYVQSALHYTFQSVEKDLTGGMTVLFAGTPCQVSAIKNFTSKISYTGKLYTIDVVCHGVPSQSMFNSYINYLKRIEGDLDNYLFRAKRSVYNGMNWYFSFRRKKGKKDIYRNWPSDAYTYYYMTSYLNRNSCYSCKYTSRDRVGDFTLCDFWHWDKFSLGFKTGSSVSGVFVNTEEALDLFSHICDNLNFQEINAEFIISNNECLRQPVKKPLDRNFILDLYKNGGFDKLDSFFRRKYENQIRKEKMRLYIPQYILNIIDYCSTKAKIGIHGH